MSGAKKHIISATLANAMSALQRRAAEAGVTGKLALFPARDSAMSSLPTRFAGIILAFAPLFVHRS
ncbi:hypothetical protein [Methylobacterium oryzisoli]|uniref:hypothetical protein n=1 Tax=Methylobacterium oryzisoli TaxID=3385502 RepID=UPI00389228D9